MLALSLIFLSFFLVALTLRLRCHAFYALAEHSVSLVNDMLAAEEDEVKIIRVQKGTGRLVRSLAIMLLVILLAFTIGGLPLAIFLLATNSDFESLQLSSFRSILSLSMGATLAFLIPLGKRKKSDYSELSQLLHRIALDNYTLSDRLFRRESRKMEKRHPGLREDFVVVSGLARAGTTSLMNNLAGIEDFVSLNYANMPFLMSPGLWARFYKPRKRELKERSHKDGIMIGYDSNEALEEFFFKLKANDSFIGKETLKEYSISPDDYRDYLSYQRNIRAGPSKIYLAKNNNFILRYASIRALNPHFLMVILFRDPLSHAASLMDKHREYTRMQEEDPFVLEYMNWLGHHEFGKNQKAFEFDGKPVPAGDRDTLDYWLKVWINYYTRALELEESRTLFINYGDYCERPGEVLGTIMDAAGIEARLPDLPSFQNGRRAEGQCDPGILKKAESIFEQLKARC